MGRILVFTTCTLGMDADEAELQRAIQKVLRSPSRRKLVVAGPGTGKTTLFKQLLESCDGEADDRLVLTFIDSLRNDLEAALAGLARVYTLHAYCMGLLYAKSVLRAGLTPDFRCGRPQALATGRRARKSCDTIR